MKYQALFAVLFSILLTGVRSVEDEWTEAEESCVAELKLDKVKMQELNNEGLTPEDNIYYNKFLACSWKKENALNENGTINWERVNEFIGEQFTKALESSPTFGTFMSGMIVVNAVEECHRKDIAGETDGQMIAKIKNCIMQEVVKTVQGKAKK